MHIVFKIWEPLNVFLHVFTFLVLPIALSSVLSAHYGAVTATLLGFALYYGSLFTSIALYRISPFHPCSRYPGPLGCKLSKLWFMRQVNKGTQHRYLQKLHEQYGDVVRIGTSTIPSRTYGVSHPPHRSERDIDPRCERYQQSHGEPRATERPQYVLSSVIRLVYV